MSSEVETKVDEGGREADLPLVAIVGRPNVGKSTLFNRLVGERRSIVGDEPGITRDRIYGRSEWAGRPFALVDTGGIVPDETAIIPANIFRQAGFAITEAVALVWVVDARAGITPLDEELAQLLRSTGKTILVAANKTDAAKIEAHAGEFHRFGFEDVIPVSAEHGDGVADLLDVLVRHLPEPEAEGDEGPDDEGKRGAREVRLAIVGRPNVGKSSILNRLLGEERAIVSPVAGTTRDAVDTLLRYEGRQFRLVDTAGIRRKGKTEEMAEKLSVIMARKSLERADVAVLVVDAVEGVAALDANIAGYAVEAGCSVIIAVNKWDAVPEKETGTAAEFERDLRFKMKFLDWAPVVTVSALAGQRVERLLPLALRADEARARRIPTSRLNEFFERITTSPRAPTAPAPVKGGQSRLHVQYVTQTGVRPPTFVVFTAGGTKGLHFSYERYLQNRLREEFDFFATPLRIIERHRSKRRRAER
ncbi:MAG TPA: ribosome biogenesis GTPase Der [Pyrinomonadaceae bacterium]|nr:ribosome biogenesis GTPase Der [Pyrinomonadaceae bacterium]